MAEKHIKKYPNGATLIYYRQNVDSTTKVVAGFLCGASKDGKKHGLAHALEHSLFHGTPEYSKEALYEIFKETGTVQNAQTSYDYIATDFDCPNACVEQIFKINGDMLAKQTFDEKEWERERKVILQELWMSLDETGEKKNSILGTPKTLSTITTKDFIRYKNKYFVTDNMVISVVSSLPYAKVKQYVEKYFISHFNSNPKNKVTIKKRKDTFKDVEIFDNLPNAHSFTIQFILKGYQDVERNDLYSHFEDWYFNGFSGKLFERLRLEEPLVYTAGCQNIDYPNTKLKVFSVLTSPENVNQCIDKVTKILGDAIENGISQKEFELFQKTMLANRERKTNVKIHNPEKLFNDYIYGQKPFVRDFFNKLMSITRDDINNYLREVYGKSRLEVIFAGDLNKAQNIIELRSFPVCAMSDFGLLSTAIELKGKEKPLYTINQITEKYRPLDKLIKEKLGLLKESDYVNFVNDLPYSLKVHNKRIEPYKINLNKKEIKELLKRYKDNRKELNLSKKEISELLKKYKQKIKQNNTDLNNSDNEMQLNDK